MGRRPVRALPIVGARFVVLLLALVATASARAGLTLLIDDLGHPIDPRLEARVLALPQAVGVSILPATPHAALWAQRCADQGRDYLAHLPWQPLDAELPPERALMPIRSEAAILYTLLLEARVELPAMLGANNHQGSRASRDADFLDAFAAAWRPFGLPFVDSRTVAGSRIGSRLRAAGIDVLENRLFIDHDPAPAAIAACLERAVALSLNGDVLVIGHPRPSTLDALEAFFARPPAGLRLLSLAEILPAANAQAVPRADWLARVDGGRALREALLELED